VKGASAPAAAAIVLFAACGDRCNDPAPRAAFTDAATDARAVPARTWPALPASDDEARRLVESSTRKPPRDRFAELDEARITSRIERAIAKGDLVVGWTAIDAWITQRMRTPYMVGRTAYLLAGTFHDSPRQLDAFRRIAGPASGVAWTGIVVEHFRATGRWPNVDASDQRGDDDLLTAYANAPTPDAAHAAFARLAEAHRTHDYSAWKLGHLDAAMDLVAGARAGGTRLASCDMPEGVQKRLGAASALRLRELHCALALEDAVAPDPPPHRIAMVWGMEHVEPEGVRRFLSADADVLVLRFAGGRPAPEALDDLIAKTLLLLEPVLVPPKQDAEDALLVLEARDVARHVDRKRAKDAAAAPGLDVTRAAPAEVRVDGKIADTHLALDPGEHAVSARIGKRQFVGTVPMPRGGHVTLHVEPQEPELTITVHEAK